MTQRTVNLDNKAWAIGNDTNGYEVFVATDVTDLHIGYAETVQEAIELVTEYRENECR